MKVIFLDIDGVIQSPRYCVAIGQDGFLSTFEPAAMHMLRYLVAKSNAKIVISSSWRHGASDREMKMLFRISGFKEIANAFCSDWRTKSINGAKRGDEIKEWLSRHNDVCSYLILDDDSDMLEEQQGNFVQTYCHNGMLLQHFDKAKEILGIED